MFPSKLRLPQQLGYEQRGELAHQGPQILRLRVVDLRASHHASNIRRPAGPYATPTSLVLP